MAAWRQGVELYGQAGGAAFTDTGHGWLEHREQFRFDQNSSRFTMTAALPGLAHRPVQCTPPAQTPSCLEIGVPAIQFGQRSLWTIWRRVCRGAVSGTLPRERRDHAGIVMLPIRRPGQRFVTCANTTFW